jgi:hypothetical protein
MSDALSSFLTGSLSDLAENFADAFREASTLKAQLTVRHGLGGRGRMVV